MISAEKRDLALQIGDFNRYANRTNLLSAHARFRLSLEEATAIVDQIQATVRARWYAVLRENGTSEADCERVSGAFNYPGFELDPKVFWSPYVSATFAWRRGKSEVLHSLSRSSGHT